MLDHILFVFHLSILSISSISSLSSSSSKPDSVIFAEPSCIGKDSSSLYKLFGTKTTYDAALESLEKMNASIPETCSPIMFYLFKRHGIRYPDADDIEEMESRLSSLRDEVLQAAESGRTSLCPEDLEKVRKWKINMNVDDDNRLSDTGVQETQQIAKRFLTRFPSVLHPHQGKLDVAVSPRERTNQTAFTFVKSIFEETHTPLEYSYTISPELTDFHTTCEKHLSNQGVFLKKCPVYNDFLSSTTMETVRKRISERLGLEYVLNASDLKTLQRGCYFGLALFNDTTWCSPLSMADSRLLELLEDLDDFFGDAYGRDINTKFPCSIVRDIVSKVELLTIADSSTKPTTAFLRFSHAGAIKPLMTFFGLFDTLNMNIGVLGNECYAKGSLTNNREWRSSFISPFSANFALVVFDCHNDDRRVLTLLQEQPVTVKGCHNPLCPVDQFLNQYRPAVSECRLDKICRL